MNCKTATERLLDRRPDVDTCTCYSSSGTMSTLHNMLFGLYTTRTASALCSLVVEGKREAVMSLIALVLGTTKDRYNYSFFDQETVSLAILEVLDEL